MAENKGLFKVYKRGQGLWTRIGLGSIVAVFILWFLVSLDASFSPEVRLVEGTQVLVTAASDKTISEEDLAKIDAYGVASAQIDVERLPDEPVAQPRPETTENIRKLIKDGRKVHLYRDVVIDTPVDKKLIELLKQNKGTDEKITVQVGGVPLVASVQTVEREVDAGKDVRLKGDVMKRTWWRRPLFTVPVLTVAMSNGNIVIALLCIAGFYGAFRLANGRRNADFLIETESELRKVDWSTKDEVFGSTKVVLLLTAVFLVLMTVYDVVYQVIMNLIRTACFPGAH